MATFSCLCLTIIIGIVILPAALHVGAETTVETFIHPNSAKSSKAGPEPKNAQPKATRFILVDNSGNSHEKFGFKTRFGDDVVEYSVYNEITGNWVCILRTNALKTKSPLKIVSNV